MRRAEICVGESPMRQINLPQGGSNRAKSERKQRGRIPYATNQSTARGFEPSENERKQRGRIPYATNPKPQGDSNYLLTPSLLVLKYPREQPCEPHHAAFDNCPPEAV